MEAALAFGEPEGAGPLPTPLAGDGAMAETALPNTETALPAGTAPTNDLDGWPDFGGSGSEELLALPTGWLTCSAATSLEVSVLSRSMIWSGWYLNPY